jgi:hypothetical protein
MLKFIGIAALAFGLMSNACAAGFVGVPTGWKLESYGANAVALWNTPSSCGNGALGLPSTATAIDHNRLYATVMAAKLGNAQMFVYYEPKDNACIITSFGLI